MTRPPPSIMLDRIWEFHEGNRLKDLSPRQQEDFYTYTAALSALSDSRGDPSPETIKYFQETVASYYNTWLARWYV